MKTNAILAVLLLLAAAAAAAPAYPEQPWYDFDNCAFCSHLSLDPQLLDHVTWESHAVRDGAITVTTVDPAFAGSYHDAMTAMGELGRKVKSGEVDPLSMKVCGRCETYGELMTAGVNVETVHGEQAEVTLVTSADADLVARIHEFVARNVAEMQRHDGREHP